eukprot:TRINITY_DN19265_c0_g1_i1.p1 TRINITY_DN19265_c0_g1~~TRINITY_DN19265_c0_g1_i1.p1  ORF type:complete len:173 (+),score=25.49 TRINITY_DN19265_c0_g1_i1:77-595(+)
MKGIESVDQNCEEASRAFHWNTIPLRMIELFLDLLRTEDIVALSELNQHIHRELRPRIQQEKHNHHMAQLRNRMEQEKRRMEQLKSAVNIPRSENSIHVIHARERARETVVDALSKVYIEQYKAEKAKEKDSEERRQQLEREISFGQEYIRALKKFNTEIKTINNRSLSTSK